MRIRRVPALNDALRPSSADEAAAIVKDAAASGRPLAVAGRGTKAGYGRPMPGARPLDLSALTGIRLYEPEELVMTAMAATPLREIQAMLTQRGQLLAFEPPDLGPLFGGEAEQGTIGGAISCNLSGPRRLRAGAARDHVLGLQAVNGEGQAFRAGGRVVKNVTGYDLPKLVTGAFGTLCVLTEVTFKVLPLPETAATVLVLGADAPAGVAALTRALGGPHEATGAAWLPAGIAVAAGEPALADGRRAAALRLEGFGPSVDWRARQLAEELAGFGEIRTIGPAASDALWAAIRDVAPLLGQGGEAVWRLSVPPTDGARISAALGEAPHYLDWGGGLVWAALPPEGDAGAARLRALLAKGGHATLVRAPEAVRAAIPVFQPQPEALAALTARVKQSFDPLGILNPGRMHAGV